MLASQQSHSSHTFPLLLQTSIHFCKQQQPHGKLQLSKGSETSSISHCKIRNKLLLLAKEETVLQGMIDTLIGA